MAIKWLCTKKISVFKLNLMKNNIVGKNDVSWIRGVSKITDPITKRGTCFKISEKYFIQTLEFSIF